MNNGHLTNFQSIVALCDKHPFILITFILALTAVALALVFRLGKIGQIRFRNARGIDVTLTEILPPWNLQSADSNEESEGGEQAS